MRSCLLAWSVSRRVDFVTAWTLGEVEIAWVIARELSRCCDDLFPWTRGVWAWRVSMVQEAIEAQGARGGFPRDVERRYEENRG